MAGLEVFFFFFFNIYIYIYYVFFVIFFLSLWAFFFLGGCSFHNQCVLHVIVFVHFVETRIGGFRSRCLGDFHPLANGIPKQLLFCGFGLWGTSGVLGAGSGFLDL